MVPGLASFLGVAAGGGRWGPAFGAVSAVLALRDALVGWFGEGDGPGCSIGMFRNRHADSASRRC